MLKPHPGEDTNWYHERLGREHLTNVIRIDTEFIWDMLSATDLHLHHACTTAVEAWFLRKPTIDLQLNPRDVYRCNAMAPAEETVRDEEALIRQVGRYLEGMPIRAEQQAARAALIERWFNRVDGRATERHADAINAFLSQRIEEPRIPLTGRTILSAVKISLRDRLGLEPHESLRAILSGSHRNVWGDKGRYFSRKDVQTWRTNIRRVLPEAAMKERPQVRVQVQGAG